MKKIFLTITLTLFCSITSVLAKDENPKYLAGAVPEENGLVVFAKSFTVKNQTDAQLYETLMAFVKGNLVENGIQEMRSRITSDGNEDGNICANVEEWMLFKKKPLYLDQARFRYQIIASVKNSRVSLRISQISYLYEEEYEENKPTGKGGIVYRAEEWINDANALNKKGTKLYPRSGKFRRKTVDRVEKIFESAMDIFEQDAIKSHEAKKQSEAKKVRSFVTE